MAHVTLKKIKIAGLLIVLTVNPAFGNVLGVGTQNFNPTTDGLDYVTVHSTKTLQPGIINIGGFFNYAANSLPYVDTGVQSRTKLNDTLFSSDFSLGVGLTPNFSMGLSLPAVISQSVEKKSGIRGDFSATGSTEIRLNGKWRFAGDEDGGLATVATINFQRTRNDPYAGRNSGNTYNLEVVADKSFSRQWVGAVNLGYRFRNPGSTIPDSYIEPMKNQWIASMGTSYHLENYDTKVIGEIYGAIPAQSEAKNPTRDMTSAELLVGLKHDRTQQLALHVGAGTEILQGVSSPDWRLYTGFNYTFGPVFKKQKTVRAHQPVAITDAPAKIEKFSVGQILFKFDSAEMVNDYQTILAGLVSELRRQKFKSLTIEGHTDSMGSVAYNNDLSLRRARAIQDYLVNQEKVPAEKIKAYGHGPSQPIASNANYQGRQANRRVEFTIERD